MRIDIDTEKSAQNLGLRERIALRIILVAFFMIAPVKYQHQLDEFFKELFK